MDWSFLENRYLIASVYGVIGAVITFVAQKILKKRSLFTYFVQHYRVGLSTEDDIFGSVKVIWNDKPIPQLYYSMIELVNNSMKDYEAVKVRVYTGNTLLLTERTEIVGTTHNLDFTDEYANRIRIPDGQEPTKQQSALYHHSREYYIPTMNRGQIVRFQFLNVPEAENQPLIWLDILHKGVKSKFRIAYNKIFGISQPLASIAGIILGIVFVGLLILFAPNIWFASVAAFIFGVGAQITGAFFLKLCRRCRDWLAG